MRTFLGMAALVLATGALCAQAATAPLPLCVATAPPIPSGPLSRPNFNFSDNGTHLDYLWTHSSTNLQGYAAQEKFAACLFYDPTDADIARQLGHFRSALVVNNPSPTAAAHVSIELYDRNGTALPAPLSPIAVTIAANGSWSKGVKELQAAARGVGSARIKSDLPIVGASLHYLDGVYIGGSLITDHDPGAGTPPGEGSMQQLQARQDGMKTLYAGPMPISNSSTSDFLNGNLPFYCVRNIDSAPTQITSYKGTSGGLTFPTVTATVPGNGLFIDMSLWNAAEALYLSGGGAFDDNGWAFVGSSNASVIGDLYLADFFAGGSPANPAMSLGRKFRMASAMMANSPSINVTSAEVTQQDGTTAIPQLDTTIGVLNASVGNIGPVTVTYRDRNGTVTGTNVVTSLPPGQTLRLGKGTPGFPASPSFDGWADIRACLPGLVGWSAREVTRVGGSPHFEKAYGEELAGANGLEPGKGIPVVRSGVALTSKVAPFDRVSSWWWPGYKTFANNSSANVGNYWYRYYNFAGTDRTNYAPQPFTGLPFGATSFAYNDGAGALVLVSTPSGNENDSGRVEVTTGTVIGITTAGDPIREWEITDFPAPGGGTGP